MEKSNQQYLVLLKVSAGKGGEFWSGFSQLPEEPMKGVKLEASYSLFGNWDFAIIFKADSNDNALHFVGEKIRSIEGIAETSTTPLTILKEHKAP